MFVVGNRSFNTYQEAEKYCNSCDFNPDTMIKQEIKIEEEKCITCNGSGRQQIWSDKENKWMYTNNSPTCKYCEGKGKRQYYTYINGTDFMFKKAYI